MSPEFARPERVDGIGERERAVVVEADAGERAALAKRFGLLSVERLVARFVVQRVATGVLAEGRVEASVMQACSATGDPLPAEVDEAVRLLFTAADDAPDNGEEAELSAEALDTLPIENGAVDLGEAAAETMALALDPFPRGPEAAGALRAAGVVGEDEVRPATGLAGLGELLAKR